MALEDFHPFPSWFVALVHCRPWVTTYFVGCFAGPRAMRQGAARPAAGTDALVGQASNHSASHSEWDDRVGPAFGSLCRWEATGRQRQQRRLELGLALEPELEHGLAGQQ